MRSAGSSLAHTIYRTPLVVLLSGELGSGKTTFIQGLAQGLGIEDRVVSPTFALEQHHGVLTHIDLFRLSPKQAREFLRDTDGFSGIRAIEWSERSPELKGDIRIRIDETPGSRTVGIAFADIPIPSDSEVRTWIKEVALPSHIVRHMEAVASFASKIADALMTSGTIVRKKALTAAAKTHDLLRFVDFRTWEGDEYYEPSKREVGIWKRMKETYGSPHELAAERFLTERGFSEIGRIVRPHRGYGPPSLKLRRTSRGAGPPKSQESIKLETTEQLILAYADKRVMFDAVVSLDERFNDFLKRYGAGKESAYAKQWRARMKEIEKRLFPEGAPF